ncbi:heparan-alpha-glucosaminide N-acetyltransferase domain-containing protein [Flindersiella endophytica]
MTAPAERDEAAGTRGRLIGVDAARGVALLGMMAVHVLPMIGPDGGITTSYRVAGGKSAAAFAVLAGVSLALWSGGDRPRTQGRGSSLAIRALMIGIIGLLLDLVNSGIAVILPYYALLFAFAIPLIRLPRRTPAILAVAVAVVVPPVSHLIRAGIDPQGGQDPLSRLLLTGYYPVLGWLAYLCAGLAVGRLNLRSSRVAVGLLTGGAALAVVAAGATWLLLDVAGGREQIATAEGVAVGTQEFDQLLGTTQYGVAPTSTWWWLAVDTPHSTTTLDLAHTIGTSLALLGAALLIARRLRGMLLPLAAAGSMTLTLYTAHVLIVGTHVLPDDELWSYAVQVAFVVGFALLWRLTRRRGPLEQLVAIVAERRPSPQPRVPVGLQDRDQHRDDQDEPADRDDAGQRGEHDH